MAHKAARIDLRDTNLPNEGGPPRKLRELRTLWNELIGTELPETQEL